MIALTFALLPWLMCKVLISGENTVRVPYGGGEAAACQAVVHCRTLTPQALLKTAHVNYEDVCKCGANESED